MPFDLDINGEAAGNVPTAHPDWDDGEELLVSGLHTEYPLEMCWRLDIGDLQVQLFAYCKDRGDDDEEAARPQPTRWYHPRLFIEKRTLSDEDEHGLQRHEFYACRSWWRFNPGRAYLLLTSHRVRVCQLLQKELDAVEGLSCDLAFVRERNLEIDQRIAEIERGANGPREIAEILPLWWATLAQWGVGDPAVIRLKEYLRWACTCNHYSTVAEALTFVHERIDEAIRHLEAQRPNCRPATEGEPRTVIAAASGDADNAAPGEPMLRIDYKCSSCGHEWEEHYTSACDSECPECGEGDISATNWEPLEGEEPPPAAPVLTQPLRRRRNRS